LKPKLSYTIWFTQRTGSSLLCMVLAAMDIAGKPGEYLYEPNIPKDYSSSPAKLQQYLWNIASTDNGVWGLKHSFYEPAFSRLIETLKEFPTCPPEETNRTAIWESAFPNHRHIFMTRRNKVRLAVSWWKAIQSQEWHRVRGEKPKAVDLTEAYSFEAIKHLYIECSMREAGSQEFFAEGSIVPLTIVYEDFILRYEETVYNVLHFLGLEHVSVHVPPPSLDQTADEMTEQWVQRFRQELQQEWRNKGW
jgi:LPS sulfotransferase NodH